MKIITHDTISADTIWPVLRATIRRPLLQYVDVLEFEFTPKKKELKRKAKGGSLRHTYGVYDDRTRTARIFLWMILRKAKFNNRYDSVRYQAWKGLWETVFHELGHAASHMTQSGDYSEMMQENEEALARQYSKRLLTEAEFKGLLTPPKNMGLMDRQISDKIRRVLNESRGVSFSKEPTLYRFYRELIMRKLDAHHTVGAIITKLDETADGYTAASNLIMHMDDNGEFHTVNHPEGPRKGFLRDSDSNRVKWLTVRSLAEEMRLGKTHTDRAGRTQLFLPHQDYAALLNVIFYSGK